MLLRHHASVGEQRLILPAFGALTGGMDAASPEILAAMQPASMIDAIASTRGRGPVPREVRLSLTGQRK